ncbi:MAG: monovalent cation/H(+) antiporter subunit G [Myxococcota bacterium]
MTVLEIIGTIFLLGGAAFSVVGGIGMIRFPTFFSRCHAAGVTDSAGAAGVLIGLMFISEPLIAAKLFTVLAFIWLSSVASTHALVKAAYARGIRFYDDSPFDFTKKRDEDVSEDASGENDSLGARGTDAEEE